MNIKLVKSLNEELIQIIENVQKKIENHTLTETEFLDFIEKVKGKNSQIAKEIGTPKDI